MEKLRAMGLIPKQMNAYEIAATMKQANVGIGAWREFVKCVKVFCDIKREAFCVSEGVWRRLGEDHGEIDSGKYKYYKGGDKSKRPEICPWWTMDPVHELELRLQDFANEHNSFHPSQIGDISSIYTGDHGLGKLRFGTKLVVTFYSTQNPTEKTNKWTTIYPLADVKCKKDNGEIFRETVMKNLSSGINKIEKGKVKFFKENDKWRCKIIDSNETEDKALTYHDVLPYMIGDLKFLAMMLGKENFEGQWCYLCQLFHTQWKDHAALGSPWTLDLLKEQAKKVIEEHLKDTQRKGVREYPYFEIPVERYIFPILHTLMGIGNALLAYLIDIVESEIQKLPPAEIKLKREVEELEKDIVALENDLEYFRSDAEGSGSELIKTFTQTTTSKLMQMMDLERSDSHITESERYTTLYNDRVEAQEEIERLNSQKDKLVSAIKKKQASKKKKMDRIKEFRKGRKTEKGSMFSLIDKILQKYDVSRGAYHGGDFNGVSIKLLMEHAIEIFDEIAKMLVRTKSTQCKMSDEDICRLCDDCAIVFIAWDGAMSYLHMENPSDADCDRAQEFVDKAMEKMRALGLSVTVKGHGGESHLVTQMRQVGGLLEFDESWGEQYHQTGYRFDMKLRNMGSEVMKAYTRAGTDRRESKPQTIRAVKLMLEQTSKGKRKSTLAGDKARKKKRMDRREAILNS
ncbi:hypothetical protein ACHAXR_011204 [Thalassiosira sp. AJA248-18]